MLIYIITVLLITSIIININLFKMLKLEKEENKRNKLLIKWNKEINS
jgi:hypothetical protein